MSVASRFVGAHRHWRETGLGVSSQAEEHTDPRRGEKRQVGEEVLPLWAVPTHVSPPAPSDVPSARRPSSLPCSLLSQTGKCRLRGEGSRSNLRLLEAGAAPASHGGMPAFSFPTGGVGTCLPQSGTAPVCVGCSRSQTLTEGGKGPHGDQHGGEQWAESARSGSLSQLHYRPAPSPHLNMHPSKTFFIGSS